MKDIEKPNGIIMLEELLKAGKIPEKIVLVNTKEEEKTSEESAQVELEVDLARERERERRQMDMFDDPDMNWSGHR